LNEDTYEKLISSLNLKVEEAFRFAEDSPFPDQSDAYKHVLAEE
jgi:TPP-dependent pyruvate/acetoin dehydrogenase alpha subunit